MSRSATAALVARSVALLLGALALLGVAQRAPAVSTPSGIDPRLRLDWDVAECRGRPEVRGYVYNEYGRSAINVRLMVETLDGEGRVVARTYGAVVGGVPAFNRSPFAVPLRGAGAGYRISVTSFEWRDGGSG